MFQSLYSEYYYAFLFAYCLVKSTCPTVYMYELGMAITKTSRSKMVVFQLYA